MNWIAKFVWTGARLALIAALFASCSSLTSSKPPVAGPPATSAVRATPAAADPVATTAGLQPSAMPTAAPQPTPTVEFHPAVFAAPDCSYGGVFRAIESVDALTVRFRLCEPDVAFLSKIAFPSFSIYPDEWLAKAGTNDFSANAPIGSGPFRVGDWTPGEKLVMTAYDGYWKSGRPMLKELVFRWDREGALRLVELQAGTADGIDALNPADFAAVESDANLNLLVRPALNVVYLGLNNQHSPFDDERVRRAIALGIDRRQLLAKAFPAGYEAARYFTPCAVPFGCSGDAFGDFDPERARALLAEAGFAGGFGIDLAYISLVRGYLPWPDQTAHNLKIQLWENLRIQVHLVKMEEQAFYPALDAGTLPGMYLLGWGADYPDADNFLGTHFGARASFQFGLPDEEVVSVLQQAAASSDPQVRADRYAAANTILAQRVPVVPLAHGGWMTPGSQAAAFAVQVQGVQASPFGLEDFAQLSLPGRDTFTWIQTFEPLSLYCPFAVNDVESLRACTQLAETLYRYVPGSAAVEPGLAESCAPDESLQIWMCRLRAGIRFHNGAPLDANDVAASFAVQWDADSALHLIDPGEGFSYFEQFWPGFLNANRP